MFCEIYIDPLKSAIHRIYSIFSYISIICIRAQQYNDTFYYSIINSTSETKQVKIYNCFIFMLGYNRCKMIERRNTLSYMLEQSFSLHWIASPAAFSEKVNASILSAEISLSMRLTTFSVMVSVFPDPGPARIRSGPSV